MTTAPEQCSATTNQRRRCRNRCRPGRTSCDVHAGLAPDSPATPSRLVVIDRDGVAREVKPHGELGDIVEAAPPRAPDRPVHDPARRFVVCCTRCGQTGDAPHRCEPAPCLDWRAELRRRHEAFLGAHPSSRRFFEPAPGTRPARRAVLTGGPETTPNDETTSTTPAETSLPALEPAQRGMVRSTGGGLAEPTGEPERTSDPLSGNWLE